MEYFLICALQIIGCVSHVLQKVFELDKKFPDDTLGDVFHEFWKSDKVTLLISLLILFADLLGHFIVSHYFPSSKDWEIIIPVVGWHVPYIIAHFIFALAIGYGGQRVFYKWLGKAEKILSDKAEG